MTAENRLTDFSSRLSPIVVKELRQGMRTNLFVIAFILLQTFMILCMLAGLANPSSNDASGFFWFFIISTMMIIQPLRGFNALSSEYQLNTMDLIQLTRLNGWRISFGKWAALNAQGLLFLVGVLPYLVIRYFVGNVDLVQDFTTIAAIGIGSALTTAITIGVSVFRSIILRGILLTILIILGFSMVQIFMISVLGRYGNPLDLSTGLLYSIAATFGIFFFLAFGASRIAPLTENLATRKRLFAIGFALIYAAYSVFDPAEEAIVLSGIILGLACIDAVTEPLPIFSSIAGPFRKSPFHRLAGIFLFPGWCSGLFFSVLCTFLWLGIIVLGISLEGDRWPYFNLEEGVLFVSLCNLILFPLLILHLFFARHSSHHFTFGLYIFTQASLFGLTLMTMVIANAIGKWDQFVYLCFPLPSVFISANLDRGNANEPIHLLIAIGTFVLCTTFPLLRQWKSVRAFFSELLKKSD